MQKQFRTPDGTIHTTDVSGNHFIGTKLQNPTAESGQVIGSTLPKESNRTYLPEVTGKVPFKIGENGEFVRLPDSK